MGGKRFNNWQAPKIEHGKLTPWNWVVYHPEKLSLGRKTDIGIFTAIFCQNGVIIGDDVQIGSHCVIYSISTISLDGNPIIGKVRIGKGVQIGSHSTIMPGVTIGNGSIIGAHSLVKDDVPQKAVAVGVPAKVIKSLS